MNGAFPMCRELLQLVWRVVLDGFAPYGASFCAPHALARQGQDNLGEPALPNPCPAGNRIEAQTDNGAVT
jgi:hypothetical protein